MLNLKIHQFSGIHSSKGVNVFFNEIISNLDCNFKLLRSRFTEPLHNHNSLIWYPRFVLDIPQNNFVITVHDIITYEFNYHNSVYLMFYKLYFKQMLKRAFAVVCSSNSTKNKVIKLFQLSGNDQKKLAVIPLGFPTVFEDLPVQENKINQNYILTITNSLKHKNNHFFFNAYSKSMIKKFYKLVVIGDISKEDEFFLIDNKINYAVFRNLSDTEIKTYINHCDLLVSASLSEGYNLPAAQAIRLGKKLVLSNIDVHRELYLNHANFFGLSNIEDLKNYLDNINMVSENNSKFNRSFKHVSHDYNTLFKRFL